MKISTMAMTRRRRGARGGSTAMQEKNVPGSRRTALGRQGSCPGRARPFIRFIRYAPTLNGDSASSFSRSVSGASARGTSSTSKRRRPSATHCLRCGISCTKGRVLEAPSWSSSRASKASRLQLVHCFLGALPKTHSCAICVCMHHHLVQFYL